MWRPLLGASCAAEMSVTNTSGEKWLTRAESQGRTWRITNNRGPRQIGRGRPRTAGEHLDAGLSGTCNLRKNNRGVRLQAEI